jgi:hypothetical protein
MIIRKQFADDHYLCKTQEKPVSIVFFFLTYMYKQCYFAFYNITKVKTW